MPKKLTTEKFIQKAIIIHNNVYDYCKVNYINSHTKIEIICKNHGSYFQRPDHHLQNSGCPKCSNNIKLTTEKFIQKSNIIHKNKYKYSLSQYKDNKSKIKIICPIHGKFNQIAGTHLSGKGCLLCRYDNISKIKRKTIKNFIKDAKKIHGNRYNYSGVYYKQGSNKISIKCKKHGTFYQRIQHHLDGHGCPKCHHRISKPEEEFLNYLKINIKNRQKIINRKLIDGIKGNTIYEFLGDFWHGNEEKFNDNDIHPFIKKTYEYIRKKTFDKLNILKENGYNVKYIWENDWRKFKDGINIKPNIQSL